MISRGSDVGLAASIPLSSLASKTIYMYTASGHSFAIQPTTHTQKLHNKTTLYTLQYTTATMKFIIPALALFATAFGNPTQSKRWTCNPGTYSCTGDKNGWQVCNVSGDWVVSYHELVCDLERGRNLRIVFCSLPASAHRRPAVFSTKRASRHTASLPDTRFLELPP